MNFSMCPCSIKYTFPDKSSAPTSAVLSQPWVLSSILKSSKPGSTSKIGVAADNVRITQQWCARWAWSIFSLPSTFWHPLEHLFFAIYPLQEEWWTPREKSEQSGCCQKTVQRMEPGNPGLTGAEQALSSKLALTALPCRHQTTFQGCC